MKLAKILTALFLTVCMLTSVVSAAVIDSAVYNSDTDTITIKGQLPKEEVSADLLTHEIASNKYGDSNAYKEEKWFIRGGNSNGSEEIFYDSEDTSVLKLIKRSVDWHGLGQSIHNDLKNHGFGKYRLTGKVKMKSETYDGVTYGDPTKQHKIVAKITFNSKNAVYSYNNIVETLTIDEGEWTDISVVFDVNTFGTDDNGVALEEFPLKSKLDSALTFVTLAGNGQADYCDIYVDDLEFKYIEAEYEETDKIGVTISSGDDVVYANEIKPEEEGGYKLALQLKKGASTENLVAKVYNPAANKIYTQNVSSSAIRNKNALKTDKTVQVSFDIFDYVDTRNIDSLSIIAANYDANDILINTIVTPLDITHSTLVNQNVSVGGNASKTKLFLFENTTTIIPLADADVFTSYEEAEPTLFLIGDSICVEYKPNSAGEEVNYPQQGWGVKLTEMLDGIKVVNCAHGGYSTETFLNYDSYQRASGYLHSWNSDTVIAAEKENGNIVREFETVAKKILPQIKKGDYVLLSLGINDGQKPNKSEPLEPGQTNAEKYKANLQKFIDDTKAKGAEIIFATPTANGTKTNAGFYDEDYKARGDLMVEVANANGIVCLPLGAKQAEKYNLMNETDVQKLHMFESAYTGNLKVDETEHSNDYVALKKWKTDKNGEPILDEKGNKQYIRDDTVHLTEDGAQFIAELIAEMLASSNSSLKYYLK